MDYGKSNRGPALQEVWEAPREAALEQTRGSKVSMCLACLWQQGVSVAGAEGWRGLGDGDREVLGRVSHRGSQVCSGWDGMRGCGEGHGRPREPSEEAPAVLQVR